MQLCGNLAQNRNLRLGQNKLKMIKWKVYSTHEISVSNYLAAVAAV